MRITRKAQSTLEYLIILSAITAAIILFVTQEGGLKDRVGEMYENATNRSERMVGKIGDAWEEE